MQALEIFPCMWRPILILSSLEKLELFEDAQFCFQKSIEIEPLQFSGYHNLASFYKNRIDGLMLCLFLKTELKLEKNIDSN